MSIKFMASSGLVANPNKRMFVLLNQKDSNVKPVKIKIGNVTIEQEYQAKILGMTINDKQQWSHQLSESGGFIPTPNKRLYLIRRLKTSVNAKAPKKLAKSLYISKLMLNYWEKLDGQMRNQNQQI